MTYIEYLNQFWLTSRSVAFSSNEAYLYFCLLNECNIRGWENPFECTNKSIVLTTGISEPTVIEARNRLQQKGLISFTPGQRKAKPPSYYLNDLSKTRVKPEYKPSKNRVKTQTLLKTKTKDKEEEKIKEKISLEKEISEIEKIMIDDEAQILTFLRNNRDEYPFLSVDVIRDAISDYFRKLEDEGVVYNTLKDARKHFSNWCKLKLKSEKQNGANKNNYSKNARPTFDEIGAAVEIGAGLAEAAKNR